MKTGFDLSQYRIRLANERDIPQIRQLVNDAYQELGDMGYNYTGTYQDESITRERMTDARTFVLIEEPDMNLPQLGDPRGRMIGTLLMEPKNALMQSMKRSAYVGQFGIHPDYKRRGLGSLLMDFIERFALENGYDCVQLDTAKPVQHLVEFYQERGYRIVSETRFEGKTYESWIFEKDLGGSPGQIRFEDTAPM